jgi:hypothetical protein
MGAAIAFTRGPAPLPESEVVALKMEVLFPEKTSPACDHGNFV